MAYLELITGHGESDHISSFDMRASNRGTFGKGKYILSDAENMATTIDVGEKTLIISAGSCVWSGMHIRTEEKITVPFVSPASTDYVYFWLHYVRDASNLVESVEIVSTTSNKINADLIYDELPDDVTEAYTLFYSFTFNPNGNTPNSLKNEFALIKGMNDFFEETSQKLNAQAADNAQQLNKLTSDINNKIAEFEGEMLNAVYDVTYLGREYISSTEKEPTLALSKPIKNFKAIIIHAAGWPLGVMIPGISSVANICRTEIFVADERLWISKLSCSFGSQSVTISGSRAQFYRDTLGYKQVIYDYPDLTYVSFYGIGKVAE